MKRFTFEQWLSSSLSSSSAVLRQVLPPKPWERPTIMGLMPHIGPISAFSPGGETSPARAVTANSAAEATSPSAPRRRRVEFQPIDEARLGASRASATATVFPDATLL